MSDKIMIVDDDRYLSESVKKMLTREGYEVSTAATGEEALTAMATQTCDLMILDLGLPGIDGVTTCRRLRSKHRFPIIMLTAQSDSMDKVVGLEVGADDYITKPFEPSELLARVRSHLRRATEYMNGATKAVTEMQIGEMSINFETREVRLSGEQIVLTRREYELLAYLAKNLNRAISRESLFSTVWGYNLDFNSNSLDVYIYRIRKKIEKDANHPDYLQTMRGFGFRLTDPSAT